MSWLLGWRLGWCVVLFRRQFDEVHRVGRRSRYIGAVLVYARWWCVVVEVCWFGSMKRVHESVDYIKHRDRKQLHQLTQQLGNVGIEQDKTMEGIDSVKVVDYKIVRDENGNKFTVYIIRLSSGDLTWEVSRRYNDFFRLNEAIVASGLKDLPKLPPKSVWAGFSKEFLEGRRDSLQAFLVKVVEHKGCQKQHALRSFVWKSHVMLSLNDRRNEKSLEEREQQSRIQDQNDFERVQFAEVQNILDLNESAEDLYSPANSVNGTRSTGRSGDSSSFDSTNNEKNTHDKARGTQPAEPIKKPKLDDFDMVRVLGKGSFGKVLLCRKKDTQKLYAIKVLKKQHVVKRKQVAHTKTERSVLGLVDHPFVVKLHYAFQTGDKLHFVLDFCSGGELFFHLGRAGRFSEKLGRFYAAEIALALGHLHTKGVVYRDLKPENILLDDQGHIKLADFGLSKEGIMSGIEGTHSFCGTPEYLAPEVLNRTGHGTSVDWWSLGALLYEMLTGLPPWYSQDRQQMFASIRSSALTFPDFISINARHILAAFLDRDAHKRLGSTNDIEDVKRHIFFETIDWHRLYQRKLPSPFVPRLNSKTDTGNFDSHFTKMPINSVDANFSMSPSKYGNNPMSSSMLSEGNPMFDGFTYIEQSNLAQNFPSHSPVSCGSLPPPIHTFQGSVPAGTTSSYGNNKFTGASSPHPSSPTALTASLLFEG
mmetsp:Transcript_36013/g.57639  ORF Transcript_36013/g.57639 Transcript_36013/m.57639 type:complete len:704 (+) Transcript_36013:20-2131(+)